ncbi:MAG TPA: alpha/beta fold hydrolase [Rhodothermales bacterium]|nr:alpha/beta fold hydrolase [Rhodothermales bacterium]
MTKLPPDLDDSNLARNTALVTGSVALGAYLTALVARRAQRARRPTATALPPALNAKIREQELMEGRARFYERPGEGVPVVLLHSFNAAASSFEMKPIFEHLAATTERPIYALDWFGFGLSDRAPVSYRSELYVRQLRRFLSEYLHEPADLVALSLGSEYAAIVAQEAPFLVRKLVLLSPTSLQPGNALASPLRRTLIGLAEGAGAFELFFYRLTRRDSLRSFYARQVFRTGTEVPPELVKYAFLTTHVRGAHYAPRRFVDGSLFLDERARLAYQQVQLPTLMLAPVAADDLVQDFDDLDDLVNANPEYLTVERLASGLMPHWETPAVLFEHLDAFLV